MKQTNKKKQLQGKNKDVESFL